MMIIGHVLSISDVAKRDITIDMAIAKDPKSRSSPWTFKFRTAPMAEAATRDTLAETPLRRRKLAADEIILFLQLMVWQGCCGVNYCLRIGLRISSLQSDAGDGDGQTARSGRRRRGSSRNNASRARVVVMSGVRNESRLFWIFRGS